MSPRRAQVLRDHGEAYSPGALRRHLIDVTQHLLALHGSVGLTTRKIAREAGVADGLLYNHFAGKDDLVVTALGERATELVQEFLAARPTPGAGTLEENLTTLAQAVLDFNARIVPLMTGLFGQADLLARFFAGIHAGEVGPQTAFAATIDYLAAEQALGRASADVDPVAVTELLFGACQLRALTTQVAVDPAQSPRTDLAAVVHTLIRALR